MRVGKRFGRRHEWALVPVSLVAHAQSVLRTPSEEWFARSFYTPKGGLVGEEFNSVRLTQVNGKEWRNYQAVCLHGDWLWLGDERGLAALSQLYQPGLQSLSAPVNSGRLSRLCEEMANLYGGDGRLLLSEEFRRQSMMPLSLPCWMSARSHNPDDLSKYVADPVFRPSLTGYVITFCVLTPQGAVEGWKIHCERAEQTRIRKIDVRTVERVGTFSYELNG